MGQLEDKELEMSRNIGASTISPENPSEEISSQEEKYFLDVHLDLAFICVLACNEKWRKAMKSGMWILLTLLGFGLSWFQLVVAILLFTGDSGELQRNLFVRGADNGRFLPLRALCLILIFLMTFSNIFYSLKSIMFHLFVLEKISNPILLLIGLVSNALKIASTALTIMVSFVVIMSSPDSDGAIGIVMNFTALLIVAEIDDAVTPFVFNFCGVLYGRHDLEAEAGRFIEEYEFTEVEHHKISVTRKFRRNLVNLFLVVCVILFAVAFGNLYVQFDYCNLSNENLQDLGPDDPYISDFFPKICSNSTNYCTNNAIFRWVPFDLTVCELEVVEESAAYFEPLNSSKTA